MESKTSASIQSLSGGLSNGPSQHVAPREKNYPAVGQSLSSDSKLSADLEDSKGVTTSVPVVSQSIQSPPSTSGLHVSAVDPISSPLEAHRNCEICSTEHDFENHQTPGVQDKAWNPKSTNKPTQAENVMYEDVPIRVGTVTLSVPVLNSARKEDPLLKVDKKLAEMQLSDKQHVIIPDHLQVTESEKYGLTFGSFGASFEQTAPKGPECEKSSTPPEEDLSQELHEGACEPTISCQGSSSGINMEAHKGVQQLPVNGSSPQRVCGSSETPEVTGSDLAKDSSAVSHVPQDSVVQTTKHDDQTQVLETLESQVLQANDFSESYHTQLYRPIAGVDGCLSPFAVSHAQTIEAQELPQGINSNSSPGSAPPVPTASGVVPSSIAIPQQPGPLFRQPVGVHLPHYAPNFIPYNHYISPFYFPSHTLNHFMGNAPVFPQSPSSMGMYPLVSASVAPPVKYSSSTYKADDNTGSQTHVGIPGAYAVYGSSPSVYTNNAVVMNGASVETDDVTGSQFKENNVFVAGQQLEIASCRNAGKTSYIRPKVVGPFPGPGASGSYVH